MKMDDVRAVLSNVPHHAGTYWGARDGNQGREPGLREFRRSRFSSRYRRLLATSTRTSIDLRKSLAKRLDVRLNAAEVRPIELANVQNALFLYVTQGCP